MRTKFGLTLILALISMLAVGNAVYAAMLQKSPMSTLPNREKIAGTETMLVRNADSVEVTINTKGLMPDWAYTVWWIIFHHPENCVEGCGADDLDREDVDGAAFWATGGLADKNGNATFTAQLNARELPSGDDQVMKDKTGGIGLMDTMTEIHVVVRTHGKQIAGMVDKQISTLNAGCPPNQCANEQFAVFEPLTSVTPVQPRGKLATTWGKIKQGQ